MKSLDDKARAERVVGTLTRLRGISNVGTIEQELATLARETRVTSAPTKATSITRPS
jgi:hypothetical protein